MVSIEGFFFGPFPFVGVLLFYRKRAVKESGQLVYSLINYNVTLTSQLCIYAEMHLKLLYAHISICHAAAA